MSSTPHTDLRRRLTESADGFLHSFEGVPPGRWIYAPAPEVWSVGEIAEHITTVFRGTQRLLTQKLLEQPIPAGASRVTDDFIVQSMLDRSRRIAAPGPVVPKGRWATREEMAAAFVESRDALVAWCDAVTVDLRAYGAAHLVLGLLDGVQWLIFAAAHTERHTRQIAELRRSAGF